MKTRIQVMRDTKKLVQACRSPQNTIPYCYIPLLPKYSLLSFIPPISPSIPIIKGFFNMNMFNLIEVLI